MLSVEDRTKLQSCHDCIVHTLKCPDQIVSAMTPVIPLEMKEDISAEKARWRKVEKLIDFVSRGSQGTYEVFLQAVTDTGQERIAQAIREGNPHKCKSVKQKKRTIDVITSPLYSGELTIV